MLTSRLALKRAARSDVPTLHVPKTTSAHEVVSKILERKVQKLRPEIRELRTGTNSPAVLSKV